MEDDKDLKQLLKDGAMVKAPAGFSNKVMSRIEGVQPSPKFASAKWQRIYKIVGGILVTLAIFLSFFIN